ncbi:hypothetical protein [Sorangium sp. So ce117]|uniref:hypothetical protein n=1 Tax=Sorangium sp. So ce117 TaxID=3133277 RepID=UPI003F6197C7
MLEENTPQGPPAGESARRVGALFQPFSPGYADDPARAFYQAAHREAPVSYSEAFSAYLVTGHAELTQVLREPVAFSSAHILDLPPDLPPEVIAELKQGVYELRRSPGRASPLRRGRATRPACSSASPRPCR